MSAGENGEALLMRLRQGKTLTFGQQLALLLRLSLRPGWAERLLSSMMRPAIF